jgi:hypothetical protein
MKIARYAFNPLNRTLAASPAFLKNASRLDSMEYQIIRQLRADYGEITITEEKSNRKAPAMIRFAQMEKHISQCRDAKERLERFAKIKALSQIQNSPYQYVVTWFMENYANYSEQPQFDADGFLIVKTKAEMEAEGKIAADDKSDNTERSVAV